MVSLIEGHVAKNWEMRLCSSLLPRLILSSQDDPIRPMIVELSEQVKSRSWRQTVPPAATEILVFGSPEATRHLDASLWAK
jgi:hypothetical protein